MLGLTFFSLFAVAALAAPAADSYGSAASSAPGISFDSDKSGLPLLKLPYATYRAASYDKSSDYYIFSNIRYAAPPVGELRWQKPQPPLNYSGIQDGSVGFQCHQAENNKLASLAFEALEPPSEDCLFLDLTVPGKAVRGEAAAALPVLSWVYAGGYIFGSKSAFYYQHGAPLVKNADGNIIFVAGNHRVGAFGFLNGGAIETEGTPNTGFWDQRAVHQWVRDYIHLVGGAPADLTAMGLSSGASSLLHHLTAFSGTLDPLFTKAILLSPAFQPEYDRWILQNKYSDFEARLNCTGRGLACLRSASEAALQQASTDTVYAAPDGSFGFGPAVDGAFVADLPGSELAAGHFWPNLTSLLVSHVSNEGLIFAPASVVTDTQYKAYIRRNMPNMTDAAAAELFALYPNKATELTFTRAEHTIAHWAVTCNVRWLAKAYEGRTHAWRFDVPPGAHGEDTFFVFFDAALDDKVDFSHLTALTAAEVDKSKIYAAIQSYITSFVRTGDPNKLKGNKSEVAMLDLPMPKVNGSGLELMDLKFSSMQMMIDEADTPQKHCDWWQSGKWTGRKVQ